MLIGRKSFSAGNVTRYSVSYHVWLPEGRTLAQTGFSATLVEDDISDITVDQVSVTEDTLYFFVSGGSINEAFTVQVQVSDTLGEIVVDTISFTVT